MSDKESSKRGVILGIIACMMALAILTGLLERQGVVDVGFSRLLGIDAGSDGGTIAPPTTGNPLTTTRIDVAIRTRLNRETAYAWDDLSVLIDLCDLRPCPGGRPSPTAVNDLRLALIRNGWYEDLDYWRHDGL